MTVSALVVTAAAPLLLPSRPTSSMRLKLWCAVPVFPCLGTRREASLRLVADAECVCMHVRGACVGLVQHPHLLTLYCTSSVATLPSASPAASIEALWPAPKLASAVIAAPLPAHAVREEGVLAA